MCQPSLFRGKEPPIPTEQGDRATQSAWALRTLTGLEIRPLGRPARSQSLYHCAIPAPNIRYR
jgi:hypothetical protein